MNPRKLIVIATAAILIAACHSTKKSTATPAPVTTTSSTSPPAEPVVLSKPANGIYMPGNEELVAIQESHKEITLDQLKMGYTLYAQSACIQCHSAKNIYRYSETEWGPIIDDMAVKAMISNAQKQAVYNYVLAIKAAKSKESK